MAVGLTTCADLLLVSQVPGREPGVQGLGVPVHSCLGAPRDILSLLLLGSVPVPPLFYVYLQPSCLPPFSL